MTLKERVRKIKLELGVLLRAYKDPRVPWYAKLLAALVLGYALSPIDLIPDFIPVLGYLDDLILIPLGIILVIKLIPPDVYEYYRAQEAVSTPHSNYKAAAVIIIIWMIALYFLIRILLNWLG
jgi:uncharacterized membrane protein YkvA (DUF1232 family)